ncbi:MAG TPA: hypothetical protein VFZ53_22605, partial [Polyangiaceae bacterium]
LYELVTGELPFQGDSYNARLWAILGESPRSLLEHGIDEPELWAVLQCGLAKNRNERFADMRELGRTLAAWLLARNIKTDITKAPLEAWLAHSRPQGSSLFPSLSPSIGPSEPSMAPAPPEPPPPPVRILPADRLRRAASVDALPGVVPATVDPALLAVVRARVKKERAETTAPQSLRGRPRSSWLGWFGVAAGASFVVAAIASSVGGREVAKSERRETTLVAEPAPLAVAPRAAPVPASDETGRPNVASAEAPAASAEAPAPARNVRPAARPSRSRPKAHKPKVDELKNPFR